MGMASSESWGDFRDKFKSLADEERAILQARREDRGLRVHCEYNSDRSASEDKLCRDGLFCLLYRLETGRWDVTEGPNRDFKARFEALATRAGIELGSPTGTLPLYFWLHSLSVHLRRTDSKELFARCDTGGIITNTCQSSATFCSRLEKKALETMASAPAVPLKKTDGGRKWFETAPETLDRRQIVLRNPKMHSKSLCKLFDSTTPPIPLPHDWRAKLSVSTWSEAYSNPTGRKRIQKIICTDRRAG